MTQLPPDPLYTPPDEPAPRRGCAFLAVVLFVLACGSAVSSAVGPSESSRAPASVQQVESRRPETAPQGQPPAPSYPTPVVEPTPTLSVTGTASWYCNEDPARGPISRCTVGYTDGPGRDLWAAAGPQLRFGEWRGRVVTVFGPVGFAAVTLIDVCGTGCGVLVDLYADPFFLVCGPLSQGVCEVTISW